jgi:predicted secreted protein
VSDHKLIQAGALRLAHATHRELGIDLRRQVDVYSAIERLGITLAFQPLASLSGAYIPASAETGGLPGVIINSNHPRSRQRYSAAHELGHHLRDRALALDPDTEVLGRQNVVRDEREEAAEAFASWFLMPRILVESISQQLKISAEPSQDDVYRLSLELGTSYLATANHLCGLKLLSRSAFRRLATIPPKWIKKQLAVHGPADSWGDVWRIRRVGTTVTVSPQPGDEVVIELDEIPSTGYIWQVDGELVGIHLLDSTFEPQSPDEADAEDAFGTIGTRLLTVRADRPGPAELQLVRTRPWEVDTPPVDHFTVKFSIEHKESGFMPVPAIA